MSNTTLSETVESIEEQAQRKRTVESIEDQVSRAQRNATSLRDALSGLEGAIETLQYYRSILDGMFDGTEPASVRSALDDAEAAAGTDKEALVELLSDASRLSGPSEIDDLESEIRDAQHSVESATDDVENRLDGHKEEWNERITSAKELQEIIADDDAAFDQTVSWLRKIVSQKMWDPTNSARSVIREWENAMDQWENHEDLQGLETFQEKHGLDDETIDAVRRLRSASDVTLGDIDIAVIEDIHRVPELAGAVELRM